MASDLLIVVSGTVDTEQDFVLSMESIATQVFGWEMVGRPSDTASDRDYWFASEGEAPGRYQRLYCSLQGISDRVKVEAATYTVSGTSINDHITTASGYVSWSGQREFWAAGNKDVIYFFSRSASNDHYTGGFGYLDTYYSDYIDDPNPVFVMSQAETYHKFSTDERVRAYTMDYRAIAHGSGVIGGGFLDPLVASGTIGPYTGPDWSSLLQLNAPSLRDGLYSAFRVPLWRTKETSLFDNEVRGDLPYTWQVWGSNTNIGNIVQASGILFDTDEMTDGSTFVITNQNGTNTNSYLIGPVDEFDYTSQAIPYSISNLVLRLDGSRGLERYGGVFYGGRVRKWTDYSTHPAIPAPNKNNAIQSVSTKLPEPRNNVLNGNDVIAFKSSQSTCLSGTLPVDNDMTIFVVASYQNGSTRTPVIHIRGNISAEDTLFAIEFNESSDNSATIINTAGGGTDRCELTGLSSGEYYLITNTVSGDSSSLFVNGTEGSVVDDNKDLVASAGTINYSLGVDLLAGGSLGSVYSDCSIAEIIIYKGNLAEEQRQIIQCMLAQKYNIVVEDC